MRALLDLMRENEAAVKSVAASCQDVLEHASVNLKILEKVDGEQELIKAVALERAKLPSQTAHG